MYLLHKTLASRLLDEIPRDESLGALVLHPLLGDRFKQSVPREDQASIITTWVNEGQVALAASVVLSYKGDHPGEFSLLAKLDSSVVLRIYQCASGVIAHHIGDEATLQHYWRRCGMSLIKGLYSPLSRAGISCVPSLLADPQIATALVLDCALLCEQQPELGELYTPWLAAQLKANGCRLATDLLPDFAKQKIKVWLDANASSQNFSAIANPEDPAAASFYLGAEPSAAEAEAMKAILEDLGKHVYLYAFKDRGLSERQWQVLFHLRPALFEFDPDRGSDPFDRICLPGKLAYWIYRQKVVSLDLATATPTSKQAWLSYLKSYFEAEVAAGFFEAQADTNFERIQAAAQAFIGRKRSEWASTFDKQGLVNDRYFYERLGWAEAALVFVEDAAVFLSLVLSGHLHHQHIFYNIGSWPLALQRQLLITLITSSASDEAFHQDRNNTRGKIGGAWVAKIINQTYFEKESQLLVVFLSLRPDEQAMLAERAIQGEFGRNNDRLMEWWFQDPTLLKAVYANASEQLRGKILVKLQTSFDSAIKVPELLREFGVNPELEFAKRVSKRRWFYNLGDGIEAYAWRSRWMEGSEIFAVLSSSAFFEGLHRHSRVVYQALEKNKMPEALLAYGHVRHAMQQAGLGLTAETRLAMADDLLILEEQAYGWDYKMAESIRTHGLILNVDCAGQSVGRIRVAEARPYLWEHYNAATQLENLKQAKPWDIQVVSTHHFNDPALPKPAAILTCGSGGNMDHASARGAAWGIPVGSHPHLVELLRFLEGEWVALEPTAEGLLKLRVLTGQEADAARALYQVPTLRAAQSMPVIKPWKDQDYQLGDLELCSFPKPDFSAVLPLGNVGLKAHVASLAVAHPEWGWTLPRSQAIPRATLRQWLYTHPDILAKLLKRDTQTAELATYSPESAYGEFLLRRSLEALETRWQSDADSDEDEQAAPIPKPKALILRSDHPQEDLEGLRQPGLFHSRMVPIERSWELLDVRALVSSFWNPQTLAYYDQLQTDPLEAGISFLLQEVIDADYSALAEVTDTHVELVLAPGLCAGLTGDDLDRIERPMKISFDRSQPLREDTIKIIDGPRYSQKITHVFRLNDAGELVKVPMENDADMRRPVIDRKQAVALIEKLLLTRDGLRAEGLAWAAMGFELSSKDGTDYLLQARPL